MKSKKSAFKLLIAAAGISLGVGAGMTTASVRAADDLDSLNVTAERLPNNAPVAVQGTVADKTGSMLILNRPDGEVRVKIGNNRKILDRFGEPMFLSDKIAIGDSITAFGRIDHTRRMTTVQGQALLMPTEPNRAQLILLEQEPLQSVAKYNTKVFGRAELRYLQAHYQAL